jgi:hypothetical protein
MRFRLSVLGVSFFCCLFSLDLQAVELRAYAVKWVAVPPVVDGIVDGSVSEWSEAWPAAGDFVVLETGEFAPAELSVSFQAVYTDLHLFFLIVIHDSDMFTILAAGDDSLSDTEDLDGRDTGAFYASLGDDMQILFDPDRDVSRNNDPPSNTPDQYHIALTLDSTHPDPGFGIPGFSDNKRDVRDEPGPPFQFTAAGYDLPLVDGDPDVWDPALQIGIRLEPNPVAPTTATVELAIPFADLNFRGDQQAPPVFATDGFPDDSLMVTDSPKDGDHWALQIGRLTNEGPSLVWNFPAKDSLFARPFGEIVFMRRETEVRNWPLF